MFTSVGSERLFWLLLYSRTLSLCSSLVLRYLRISSAEVYSYGSSGELFFSPVSGSLFYFMHNNIIMNDKSMSPCTSSHAGIEELNYFLSRRNKLFKPQESCTISVTQVLMFLNTHGLPPGFHNPWIVHRTTINFINTQGFDFIIKQLSYSGTCFVLQVGVYAPQTK